jgi:hypothetical protein
VTVLVFLPDFDDIVTVLLLLIVEVNESVEVIMDVMIGVEVMVNVTVGVYVVVTWGPTVRYRSRSKLASTKLSLGSSSSPLCQANGSPPPLLPNTKMILCPGNI